MIFLQGLYEWVAASPESSVNHFPLIQLVFNSVDKTILYYLIFLVLRAPTRCADTARRARKSPYIRKGCRDALFIYIVLLLQLTVFRNEVTFGTVEYHKIDWSAIHWLPLVDTVKLFLWFRIFGMVQFMGERCLVYAVGLHGALSVQKKCSFSKVTAMGLLFSSMIEFLQLIFQTGVTRISMIVSSLIR